MKRSSRRINRILPVLLGVSMMFSVNPAYDYNHGEYPYGGVDERADVYKRCEKLGVGISVMKPFSGGFPPRTLSFRRGRNNSKDKK